MILACSLIDLLMVDDDDERGSIEAETTRAHSDTGVMSIIQASVGGLFCLCHLHLNKTNTQSLNLPTASSLIN